MSDEHESNGTPPADPPVSAAGGNGTPEPLNIAEEMRASYLSYAMSVIISRALPDARDGLKPSQRRILVAMNDLGLGPSSSTSKCAGIVGETMKRYHPHGEATIYPTLVRMAQDWVMRHRLVHPQGNFGSVAGLPPAAMRYTEARLSPVAGEMLADLDRETVDFIDNYDGKYREPLVLPSRFPNLLVNGSDGIAVGMATEIPPHNLREICDALVRVIDNPDVSLRELVEIVPGPDFPTGGIIMGRQGIVDGYRTGRGKLTLRARCEIVEEKGGRAKIYVNEVPYQQTRNRLAAQIGELVKDERVKDITSVRDISSGRTGQPVRIEIDLKRGADPNFVLNQLYQYSPLQCTVSIILLALVDGRPQVLTLKRLMEEFLRHRVQVIRRKTEFLLREAKRRGHVLEGQLIAISSLDEVIEICRRAPSRAEAKERLQGLTVASAVLNRALGDEGFTALTRELGALANYQMTEAQAEAVVRMQLGQLANLERDEILKEYGELRGRIRSYEELIGDDRNILAQVRADLIEIRDKYGTDRVTDISDAGAFIDDEEMIAEETQVVTLSHKGYIKRMPLDTYRTQHRGGKGVSGGVRDEDFAEHFFTAGTRDYLLCFTDRGQLYWLKVYHIPEASRTSAGRGIANVLSLKEGEKITSVIPVRSFEGDHYLMMATRQGTVKKTALSEYSRPRQGGIIGIAIDEGDTLIGVARTKPGDEIVLSTRHGMAIRFAESQVRAMGRNARGVRGINLRGGSTDEPGDVPADAVAAGDAAKPAGRGRDEVVGMVVADPDGYLLTVCENGYGKRTPFGANTAGDEEPADDAADANGTAPAAEEPAEDAGEEARDRSNMRYRRQKRGGFGVRDIRTTDRNGPVVAVTAVREGDQVMLITSQGMVNRTGVGEIGVVGRNTLGVRVMKLNDGDRLVTLAKVAREDVVEDPADGPEGDAPTAVAPAE